MRTRKRYYATTSAHAAGIDIAIRSPDGGTLANVLGLALFDDGTGIEKAKADAKLIVEALNAKHAEQKRKAKRRIRKTPRQGYTYSRGKDWVDDTWDIYDPYDRFVLSIRFWDEPDTDEASEAEERAKLIVQTLNKGYWW